MEIIHHEEGRVFLNAGREQAEITVPLRRLEQDICEWRTAGVFIFG
ncbi:hypothetical protein [Bacillus sonorensis]|nr:hypothetical protein [Bacillus sonorensis]MCY8607129.1 hypothetical protein [Bacillus sonorensis]